MTTLNRDAVAAVIASATSHVVDYDTDEATGRTVAGCYICAENGYPCATLAKATDAVMALVRPENEVKAEALEEAADAYTNVTGGTKARPVARTWLRARASAVRSGGKR